MASSISTERLFSRSAISIHDIDGDFSTAAVATATVKDLRDYQGYAVVIMTSALTGAGMTLVELVASSDSAGTTDVTQVKTSGAVVADAVGDYVALECSAEEVRQLGTDGGTDLRYVGVRLTNDNAGDECVGTCILYGSKHGQTGLTATAIS